MEHRPEDYSICVVNATGRRENLDQRARVASAARAASFKRPSVCQSKLTFVGAPLKCQDNALAIQLSRRQKPERTSEALGRLAAIMKTEAHISMRYTVVLEREADGGYIATVPALPGCVSQGDTRDEVTRNIREAADLYIEDCLAAGDPVPTEAGREYFELTTSSPR